MIKIEEDKKEQEEEQKPENVLQIVPEIIKKGKIVLVIDKNKENQD